MKMMWHVLSKLYPSFFNDAPHHHHHHQQQRDNDDDDSVDDDTKYLLKTPKQSTKSVQSNLNTIKCNKINR